MSDYRCPKCNSDCLTVAIVSFARFSQDEDGNIETDSDGFDQEWDNLSRMLCRDCDYDGIVHDFKWEDE